MGLMDRVSQLLADLLLERPVRNKTLGEIRDELDSSGREAEQRLATAADTGQNREALRHIIGIERWGQRRLQAALGEPLLLDESDGYYPASDASWEQLQEMFQETRRKTLAIAGELDQANVGREVTVPHNQWGNLTVYGWLQYLRSHANRDVNGIN
jgi:hypothetical protein